MNLIEELGIEKARAIVDGTPSGATDYSNEDGEIIYYQKTNNLIYWDSELGLWDEVYFSMPELKSLPDLRTAIANHDLTVSNSSQNDKQIDLSIKKDIEDHCTDIRNHISPLTGVIER